MISKRKIDIIYASPEIQKQRMSECLKCEYFTVGSLLRQPLCAKCGCFLKGKLPTIAATCPLHKWK